MLRFLSVHPLQFTDPPALFEPVGSVPSPAGPVPVFGFETDDPDLAARLREVPASFGVVEGDWPEPPSLGEPAPPSEVQDAPQLVPGSPAAEQSQPVPGVAETATFDAPTVTPATDTATPAAAAAPTTPAA